jgi:hypothetical protein
MVPFLEDHMNLELLPNITKYSLWLISAIVIYISIYTYIYIYIATQATTV